MRMCQLSEIFNQILIHIYDLLARNAEPEIQAYLATESRALGRWWDDLPEFLRIDAKYLPAYCPPSHIVTFKYVILIFPLLICISSKHEKC